MASAQDTEITLGTGKLLVLFFGLVAICATFFAVGYSLGRKSEPGISTASAALSPQPAPTKTKSSANSTSQPPMTFYKAVEQKDANPELTPASEPKPASNSAPANSAPAQTAAPAAATPDPMTTLPSAGYFVQVAAVSKQEDAEALVDALKKKQYPAFVAATSTADKLFHVQVGPFTDIKEAEAMRARLISDGYNPILKK
ncbi:MAG: SPOR domain-containing protein [Acidobacteriia bacterium]|nr:SPOR domain-containing protein [Terriglobia bacterium]